VDLIPKDSKGYLHHIQKCLVNELENSGINRANIKLVSLISATTGFGVEQLITKIQNSWGARGDVYLLGCTNVGKSSLFNALISSDFCKTQASDLLERATVSAWPGTTLNL
jgi:ribosome biogenesis GTPase A